MQLLDAFYRDMVHFVLIMMSLPGPPTRAEIFDNPGCISVLDKIVSLDEWVLVLSTGKLLDSAMHYGLTRNVLYM